MEILLLKEQIIEIKNKPLAFKNNAPFISWISKINGVLIENSEDLDTVMPMYNLLEYSKNYSKTSGSLWNYCRDELTDETNDDNGPNKKVQTQSLLNVRQTLQEVLIMWQLLLETMMQIKKARRNMKLLCH